MNEENEKKITQADVELVNEYIDNPGPLNKPNRAQRRAAARRRSSSSQPRSTGPPRVMTSSR